MKLVSKRGTRVNDNPEDNKDSKPMEPQDNLIDNVTLQIPEQDVEVQTSVEKTTPEAKTVTEPTEASIPTPEIPAPAVTKPAPKPVPKPLYPDMTLSDKQLEAIKKVIGPSAQGASYDPDRSSADPDAKSGDIDKPEKKKKKKKKSVNNPDEIVVKDRTVIKTVFFVIFLVLVLLGAGFAGFYYWWTEYATFEYELTPVVILEGQSITPGLFLNPEENAEGVAAAFQNPESKPVTGLQYIPLTLTLGLRTVDASAALFVLSTVESIEHEFAEEGAILRPVDFLSNPDAAARVSSFDIRFTEAPLPLEEYPVGEFTLHLALNDAPFEVMLYVVDTTPPRAAPVEKTTIIGEEVFPEDFVTDVFDASPVISIKFVEEPDVFALTDEQAVQVIIEDYFGNTAVFNSVLYVQFNQIPPEIEGVVEFIESEINTLVEYFQGVTAHDDFGRELTVHVDESNVDKSTEGVYIAVIWAEDYSGQRTEIEMTVYILPVSPEYIYQRADEILSGIIRANMTQAQKVRAINEWIRWTMKTETTESTSPSLLANAYKGIDSKRGDANIFAAVSELLLTRAGIQNMRIERVSDAETKHVWNLVNPDERGWYHFDTFPNVLGMGSNNVSMFTAAQAKTFAERIESRSKVKNYYTFDPELYPEIVQGD